MDYQRRQTVAGIQRPTQRPESKRSRRSILDSRIKVISFYALFEGFYTDRFINYQVLLVLKVYYQLVFTSLFAYEPSTSFLESTPALNHLRRVYFAGLGCQVVTFYWFLFLPCQALWFAILMSQASKTVTAAGRSSRAEFSRLKSAEPARRV